MSENWRGEPDKIETPELFKEIEKLLAGKCKDYCIIGIMDERIHVLDSSICTSYGMCKKMIIDIEAYWNENVMEEEE